MKSTRIPLLYAVFGIGWIIITDLFTYLLGEASHFLVFFQTFKGSIFVVVTTLLLYVLLRRAEEKEKKYKQERIEIYQSMLQAMDHILRNFLQQMRYFQYLAQDEPQQLNEKKTKGQIKHVIETTIAKVDLFKGLDSFSLEELRDRVAKVKE